MGDSGIKSCLGPEWSLNGDLTFLCEISPDFDSQRDFFFSEVVYKYHCRLVDIRQHGPYSIE